MAINADFLETMRSLVSVERLFVGYTHVVAMMFRIPVAVRSVVSTDRFDVVLTDTASSAY
ncbi:hypothetical protein [Rhizobium bangladeshense]|uniref:hypothetical protein n=1 Tax=Rhizobium bangladeshense TaxID=1138189 RepID=UPI0007E57FAE|nr:hypothetical protein [Rhizobium bangladeshense]